MEKIGRFRVRRLFDEDALATTHSCRDDDLDQRVLVRLQRPAVEVREQPLEFWMVRLLLEARVHARLPHPAILAFREFGRLDDGRPWLATGYAPRRLDAILGEEDTSSTAVSTATLSTTGALHVVRQILAGLTWLHAHGIAHRDIRPENVLLSGGRRPIVWLRGFANALHPGIGAADWDGRFGDPRFIAPERYAGTSDVRADLFAVGVLATKLLTGQFPDAACPRREPIGEKAPPPPVRDRLGEWLAAMLEREPSRRPVDGAAALLAFDRVTGGPAGEDELG